MTEEAFQQATRDTSTLTDQELKGQFLGFTRALRDPEQAQFTREEERSQALLMREIAIRGLDFLAWERELSQAT